MHPIKVQLGVSYLENGTKVLTPFARCGKIYAYDEWTALALDSVIVTVLWLGVLAAGNITVALCFGIIGAPQALALFPLAFILLDALRVGVLIRLFRSKPLHAHPFKAKRRLSGGPTVAVGPTALRRVMTALDALMFYGAIYNVALDLPTLGVSVLLACAAHLGVYVAQLSVQEAVSGRA